MFSILSLRSILERKAAMYDRLKGGVEALEDDNINQKFLVDFQVRESIEFIDNNTVKIWYTSTVLVNLDVLYLLDKKKEINK